MTAFGWRGQRVPRVELDDVTMGELIWCERQLGTSLSEWTTGQEAAAMGVLALRRADVRTADGKLVGLDDLLETRFGDIEIVPDTPDDADPTPASDPAQGSWPVSEPNTSLD